ATAPNTSPIWRLISASTSAVAFATRSAAPRSSADVSLAPSASPLCIVRATGDARSTGGLPCILSMDTVLFHEPIERRPVDAREAGRFGHVPTRPRNESREILLLEVGDQTILR